MPVRYLALVAISLVAVVLFASTPGNAVTNRPLRVITTFPGLKYDVQNLVCEGDVVETLLPPGVDPHEYSLTPGDITKLQEADLIVSTGHTGFEQKIEELWRSGVIKGVLINVLELPGITIFTNPSTGQPDYHMPIYYPLNYIAFVRNVSETLASLNPAASQCYLSRALNVTTRVAGLYVSTPPLRGKAVGDLPYTVYVANWLGLDLAGLIIKEEGLPATPGELSTYQEMMRNGSIAYVLVTVYGSTKSTVSTQLENMAASYGVKVIKLYGAVYPNSILDKLVYVYTQITNTSLTTATETAHQVTPSGLSWFGVAMIVVAVITLVGLAVYLLVSRK
ncbi:periplasmic solute binding protein [Thermogladius calderae 1633]|uniref:Periplasmic solute binding protein n=1 Tax=Thermogladius calderae (strain DSM 22663 / VKM B-2946 / 1633) TaxID=1184251 RepID=I3TE94_THEC1|nr:zinc ABC transporter substrate-binding protein [Thermogladius calderae]AFK51082.1 periplasmic solute binding protein [Thermogladius calderae 1633]